MDSSSNCQNRRSRRSHVLLSATIEQLGSARAVTLRNLSEQGALIQSKDLPPVGSEVIFRRSELAAAGRLVWVKGQYAGVAFHETLAPEQVLRHIPAPRPKVQPKYWRPGLSTRDLTPEQRSLAESWVWSPATQRPGE